MSTLALADDCAKDTVAANAMLVHKMRANFRSEPVTGFPLLPKKWETIVDLARRPRQRATAEQVHVQMKHRLSRAGSHVEDGAVSLFDVALAGNLGGREMAAADDLRISRLGFFQSRKVFFRNDQNMCRSLRIDVFEGEDVIVFVNFLGGNFAADDTAEKAVGIAHIKIHLAETIAFGKRFCQPA